MSHVDLGKGDDAYKRSFANDAWPLMESSVLVPSVASGWRKLRTSGGDFLRKSSWLNPVRSVWRHWRGAQDGRGAQAHHGA
jgi:CelD/BcsL family acetyltransferase involved in cellulose biosynthesis